MELTNSVDDIVKHPRKILKIVLKWTQSKFLKIIENCYFPVDFLISFAKYLGLRVGYLDSGRGLQALPNFNKIYFQVSSPLLRNVQFRYQEDEILANSLTSTNFHTYYQGSELVVAGRLPVTNVQSDSPALPNDLIKYEILGMI